MFEAIAVMLHWRKPDFHRGIKTVKAWIHILLLLAFVGCVKPQPHTPITWQLPRACDLSCDDFCDQALAYESDLTDFFITFGEPMRTENHSDGVYLVFECGDGVATLIVDSRDYDNGQIATRAVNSQPKQWITLPFASATRSCTTRARTDR